MSTPVPGRTGRIHQVNVSRGGVPKLPVTGAQVLRLGLDGDGHDEPEPIHGGELQAVSLFCVEALARVAADGHQAFPGAYGENLTLEGIDWSDAGRGRPARDRYRRAPRRAHEVRGAVPDHRPLVRRPPDRADQPEDPPGGCALVRTGDRRGSRRDRRRGRGGRRRRRLTPRPGFADRHARPAWPQSRANRTPQRSTSRCSPVVARMPTRAVGTGAGSDSRANAVTSRIE